jgi:uncharacterized DUF497 family protein
LPSSRLRQPPLTVRVSGNFQIDFTAEIRRISKKNQPNLHPRSHPQESRLKASDFALYTYNVCILVSMADDIRFDWDEANTEHIARHDVMPAEIEQVFANFADDLDHDHSEGEDRWTSIGHGDSLRVLVVIWTMRGDVIRPITAWEPNRRMREQYLRRRGIGR